MGSAGRKEWCKSTGGSCELRNRQCLHRSEGFGYCKDTADAAAKALNISADGVLIGSTGVIGKQIPIDKLTAGIKVLAGKKNDTLENGTEAAKAIMTTDTFPKELAVAIEVGGKTVRSVVWQKDLE